MPSPLESLIKTVNVDGNERRNCREYGSPSIDIGILIAQTVVAVILVMQSTFNHNKLLQKRTYFLDRRSHVQLRDNNIYHGLIWYFPHVLAFWPNEPELQAVNFVVYSPKERLHDICDDKVYTSAARSYYDQVTRHRAQFVETNPIRIRRRRINICHFDDKHDLNGLVWFESRNLASKLYMDDLK